jgi:hypothetical protein
MGGVIGGVQMIMMLLKEIYELERQLGHRNYATEHSFAEWLQHRGVV